MSNKTTEMSDTEWYRRFIRKSLGFHGNPRYYSHPSSKDFGPFKKNAVTLTSLVTDIQIFLSHVTTDTQAMTDMYS